MPSELDQTGNTGADYGVGKESIADAMEARQRIRAASQRSGKPRYIMVGEQMLRPSVVEHGPARTPIAKMKQNQVSAASEEVADYVRLKRIALGRHIKSRTKVYLDTKFWVILREVRLGRSRCEASVALLNTLEQGVIEGRIICPLNADVYFEVLKQNDQDTLLATATLIDDLSLGLCLAPLTERLQSEFFHFLESAVRGAEKLHPLSELVWTKTSYVLGFKTPDCYELSFEHNVEVQKKFADYMWSMRLADQIRIAGHELVAMRSNTFADISPDLNVGKFQHADDHGSFKSVFLSEIRGILDCEEGTLNSLMQDAYERDTGNELSDQDRGNTLAGEQLAELIYHAFRL